MLEAPRVFPAWLTVYRRRQFKGQLAPANPVLLFEPKKRLYEPPSGIHCSMLRPAVNRQPGFRRGTRRAKQRREEQLRWLAGWLAGWLAAGSGQLPRLARHGWLADELAGCLAGWLAKWLPGWLLASASLTASLPGWLARFLADCLAVWLAGWLYKTCLLALTQHLPANSPAVYGNFLVFASLSVCLCVCLSVCVIFALILLACTLIPVLK